MTVLPQHIVQRSGAILLLRMALTEEIGLTLVYPDGTLADTPMNLPKVWDFFVSIARISSIAITGDPFERSSFLEGRQNAHSQLIDIVPAFAQQSDLAMLQIDSLVATLASLILERSEEVEKIATFLLAHEHSGQEIFAA